MSTTNTLLKVTQPFSPVNSQLNTQLPLLPDTVIHYKEYRSQKNNLIVYYSKGISIPYGVSPSRRLISPGLLLKRFDQVRECLKYDVGLTPAQREAALGLIRLWVYYGRVYPKAAQVADGPEVTPELVIWRAEQGLPARRRGSGPSRATFWRTVRILKDQGLIYTVNRFVIRPRAQISNLYHLEKLILLIAHYILDRCHQWLPDCLLPLVKWERPDWWQAIVRGEFTPVRLFGGSPTGPE